MIPSDSIIIHPDSVRELADRIERVSSELQDAKSNFDDNDGILASPPIEQALAHFNASWSDTRGKLERMLVHAASMLRTVANDFQSADTGLKQGLDGKGAGQGGATCDSSS